MLEMDLETAFELLKATVKQSEALDKARHFDLTLVSSHDRENYIDAIKRIQKAIRLKEVTQEFVEKRTSLKL